MGLITSSGIGSGIDVESIIRALLDAERAPKESSLSRNEHRVDSTLSALGQLTSALSTLNDALEELNSLSDFKIRSATSSDQDFMTATANTDASSGSFEIEITTLAQGSKLETVASTFSDITDTVGAGILTLSAGTESFEITIAADDSLEDIRNSINSATDNFGVNVNIINAASGPILSYTSSISGDGNTLTVSNNNSSLDSISTNLTTEQSANDATAIIDGITVTSNSNIFTDAIQDISFTALKETEANAPITLDVDIDKSAVKDAVSDFVSAINDYQTLSAQLGKSEENNVGVLAGDITLRLLNQKIVSTLQNTIIGITSDYDTLNSLGITFDEFGQLNIDDNELDSVLNSNFDAIADVFASTNGVSITIQDVIDNYLGSGSLIDIREDSLNNQKRQIEKDRLNFDYRMTQLETQLRSKFGAMDALVAQFNNTGNYLTQQLANLPGFGSNE